MESTMADDKETLKAVQDSMKRNQESIKKTNISVNEMADFLRTPPVGMMPG